MKASPSPHGAVARHLFAAHIAAVCRATDAALRLASEVGLTYDGILFHSGSPAEYHGQDRPIPFQPVPHFTRFAPVAAPDNFILFRPGMAPRLIQLAPADFWNEPCAVPDHPYSEVLAVTRIGSLAALPAALGSVRHLAYVGDNPEVAARLGIERTAVEPGPLMSALDWHRAEKTPYEIEMIRRAAQRAARGHAAARDLAGKRASERAIHAAYLAAIESLEHETPYTNIVAWDDRTAVLHYGTKRLTDPHPGHVFLIDAGAAVAGYTSDITRTYAYPGADSCFLEALRGMEALQRALVEGLRPGRSFVAFHEEAALAVCGLLRDLGILRIGPEDALARGLAYPFFPHGVGHHLGIQVHDVGGKLTAPLGPTREAPPQYPFLRTTRALAPGQVVTVEPGLYFIPLLLAPLRAHPDANCIAWDLVDTLQPCGGIRIEDDVLITADGCTDLSRPLVPGMGE